MSQYLQILVTGAAGMLGSELTSQLARAGHAIAAMVNQTTELRCNDGREIATIPASPRLRPGSVALVNGNIQMPRCGMEASIYESLIATTDLIVHCAAVTEFGREPHVYEAVNVCGTENVVALALHSQQRRIPLIHVSTAYVSGDRHGLILETDLENGQRFGNPYEQSKFQAERLIRAATRKGLEAIIVRPSIVVGDSRTGQIREFKNIYPVLKAVTEGRVRSIPGNYDATLDLVPIDYVAATVRQIALQFSGLIGRTFHIVSGQPITLQDFSDVLAEYPSMLVPRFVPAHSFDASRLPAFERRYYNRVVRLYESYFLRKVNFSNQAMLAIMDGVQPPQGKQFLRTLIDYCEQVDYLGPPSSRPSDANESIAGTLLT